MRIRSFNEKTYVKLVGPEGSAAAELVDLWRQTRTIVHRSDRGDELFNEKDVWAYRWISGLRAPIARSSFEFTWPEFCGEDLVSIPGVSHEIIEFTGSVAEDIYRSLVKAGTGVVRVSPIETVVSRKWVRCNRVEVGLHGKFFCLITAQPPAPGISPRFHDYH